MLGQAVVLFPFLFQPFFLVRRQVFDLLVALARVLSLLGGQLGPGLHASLHPRLLIGLHFRIALGNADPLALARGLKLVPVGAERRENLLLLGRQLSPGGGLLRCGGGDRERDAEAKC